jgi:hypothetical protein
MPISAGTHWILSPVVYIKKKVYHFSTKECQNFPIIMLIDV